MPPPTRLANKNLSAITTKASDQKIVHTIPRQSGRGLKVNKRLMAARKDRRSDGIMSGIFSDPLTGVAAADHPAVAAAIMGAGAVASATGRGHAKKTLAAGLARKRHDRLARTKGPSHPETIAAKKDARNKRVKQAVSGGLKWGSRAAIGGAAYTGAKAYAGSRSEAAKKAAETKKRNRGQ